MSDPAPPQGPYQQQPYPQQGYQQQGYQQQPQYPQQQGYQTPAPAGWSNAPVQAAIPAGAALASYGQRVGAYFIDILISVVALIPGYALLFIGIAASNKSSGAGGLFMILAFLLFLVALVFTLWNVGWRQGATGQSFGKGVMKIKLIKIDTGQPPGGGLGLGRYFIRIALGGITGGIYSLLTLLWPLWDERRQTLDDKIVGTLVVEAR